MRWKPSDRPTQSMPDQTARLGAGMDDLNGLVAPVSSNSLVGSNFVEPFARGDPASLAVLEDGRGQPARGERIKRVGVEADADQGEKVPGLPVTGPEDLIVPRAFFPAGTLYGIDAIERGHEARLQPFALAVEQIASLVDVQVFKEHTQGPLQHEECRDQADGQDTSPDQPTHVQPPATSLKYQSTAVF